MTLVLASILLSTTDFTASSSRTTTELAILTSCFSLQASPDIKPHGTVTVSWPLSARVMNGLQEPAPNVFPINFLKGIFPIPFTGGRYTNHELEDSQYFMLMHKKETFTWNIDF